MASFADGETIYDQARRSERRFFASYALILLLLALVGFSRTFHLRWAMPADMPLPPLTPLLVVHGLLLSAFLLLYPLQAWAITAGKRRLHMRIGPWGLALGALSLPLIYVVAMENYHAPGPRPPALTVLQAILPISLLLVLPVLLWFAWSRRMDVQAHKRFVILAGCVFIAPAITRLPLSVLVDAPHRPLFFIVVTQSLMFATMLPLWFWDWRALGRIHWATALGSGLFALVLVGRSLLASTFLWRRIVESLPGFGPLT